MFENFPIDMVVYLALAQAVPLAAWAQDRSQAPDLTLFVVVCQSALITIFLLVWGGYAKDSWTYLPGFDGNPFSWNDEWLFWILGFLLNKLVVDPWPLKIICALGAAIMCYAIISFFRASDRRYCIIGLFVLLLVPAFYLLMGSAIRQGFAGALIAIGLVNLFRDRYRTFLGMVVLAFFFHQSAVVFAAAGVAARLSNRGVSYALIAAPILGFIVFWVASKLGIEIDRYVPHIEKHEGTFHWTKFFVSYVVAFGILFATRNTAGEFKRMVSAYGYMVAISAVLVQYEVPFERLLGYSDLLLPFAAAIAVGTLRWDRWRLAGLWLAGLSAGVLLWSHPSIVATLGYATT